VWKTSSKFLVVIAYTGEFFANFESELLRFEVISIDDKEITFTTKKPELFNEEILNRQILRVTISEERPVRLLIGRGNNVYGYQRKKSLSLAYFPVNTCEENSSHSLLLNVYDISVGGIGLIFKGEVKAFKPGKKIRMKLIFFRKISGGAEIKEREISVLGEVVRKEKITEDLVNVGIKFVDLHRISENYKFIFNYVLERQREIRKQMELLIEEFSRK
jgi:hypothetical protein